FRCPWQGGRIAAEVSAERTTALTQRTVLALRAPLLDVNRLRLGDVRTPRNDDMTVFITFLHRFLEELLYAIHRKRRQKFAVGKLGQSVFVSGNSGKLFYVAVPGREVPVTDGPVDGKTVAGRSFKVEVTPPLRMTRPEDGLAAHLVPTHPVERFFLNVRVL